MINLEHFCSLWHWHYWRIQFYLVYIHLLFPVIRLFLCSQLESCTGEVVFLSGYSWRRMMTICLLLVKFDHPVMVLPNFQLYNYCVFFSPFQLISNLWGDTLIQCKYPAPRQNVPIALAFIEASCLITLLTMMLAKCWFSHSCTPSIFISHPLAFYCK